MLLDWIWNCVQQPFKLKLLVKALCSHILFQILKKSVIRGAFYSSHGEYKNLNLTNTRVWFNHTSKKRLNSHLGAFSNLPRFQRGRSFSVLCWHTHSSQSTALTASDNHRSLYCTCLAPGCSTALEDGNVTKGTSQSDRVYIPIRRHR